MIKKAITLIFSLLAVVLFLAGNTFAQNSTDEADPVLQKIKERVESIRKNPKAYIGTVTDKTQDTMQIKNASGKIQQIAIKENSEFVKLGKTSTNIKFADIALGDYIVAMGYSDGNSILDVKRTLLIPPLEDLKRKTFFGKINFLDKKDMRLTDSGEEVAVSFPKSWKGPEIKELSVGLEVLLVVEEIDGKYMIRTIQTVTTHATVTPAISRATTPTP